jgi:hypothetical protein
MTVVAQELRLNELRRLGMSEPLIQLAAGNCIHKVFRDICLGPPFYVYHPADVPAGPDRIAHPRPIRRMGRGPRRPQRPAGASDARLVDRPATLIAQRHWRAEPRQSRITRARLRSRAALSESK